MSCASLISCLTNALERLGLYEPKISLQQARTRLEKERDTWKKNVCDRSKFWKTFNEHQKMDNRIPDLVEQGLVRLREQGIQKGVAVDLGCGISSTTFILLELGWKVYAVDNSSFVINKLGISHIKRIQNKQLVLVSTSIEKFVYPEKVHLIIAMDSLSYCDPLEIQNIFLKAQNALLPQGVFVCTLVSYKNPITDWISRTVSGTWMTTKNVVEAVMKSMHFTAWSIAEKRSPAGWAKLFHVFAEG